MLEATLSALIAIGIAPVTVRVNDRRLLATIAREVGVSGDVTGAYFVTLDKLDKIGWEGVRGELVERGLDQSVGERSEWIIETLSSAPSASLLLDSAADLLPSLDETVVSGLRMTATFLSGIEETGGFTWRLDPTVVRGMGYYTGQIFEIGHAAAAGSIAGGGRYDGLVGRSLGREVPACGISIGFDRVVELARFSPPDLGVAVLYSDQPLSAALSVTRQFRVSRRAVALVARRGQMRVQLDALAKEGFTSFVVLEGDNVSDERSLGG